MNDAADDLAQLRQQVMLNGISLVVLEIAVLSLLQVVPNPEDVHAKIQSAWNVARGGLGMDGTPDEATARAQELLGRMSRSLGITIV